MATKTPTNFDRAELELKALERLADARARSNVFEKHGLAQDVRAILDEEGAPIFGNALKLSVSSSILGEAAEAEMVRVYSLSMALGQSINVSRDHALKNVSRSFRVAIR